MLKALINKAPQLLPILLPESKIPPNRQHQFNRHQPHLNQTPHALITLKSLAHQTLIKTPNIQSIITV
jgi:hypothetical protein